MPNFLTRILANLTIDGIIYQARWLLYPVNLGLFVASFVFLLRFLWQTACLVAHLPTFIFGTSDSELTIAVVKLVDQAMIMTLLVLTLMSTHQIYVRRFKTSEHDVPQWLVHIDTIKVKVKLGLAFVGYSSAKLLEDIITKDYVSHEVWLRHVYTHLVFLGTTLIVALVWRIMHHAPPKT